MKRAVAAVLVLATCTPKPGAKVGVIHLPADPMSYQPLTRYVPMTIPEDNPMTPEKAALGRQLFFDSRLSGDGKRSCYSCHLNEKGLTDGMPVAIGAFEKKLTRNSPTLWNIGYHAEYYWDGRAKSLETQAMGAWKLANMGAGDRIPEIVAKLNGIRGYREQFRRVFGGDATPENVCKALACYMRTIVSRDTAFDRGTMSEAAQRGWKAFEKAKCTNCHSGVLFADQQYHNVGIGKDDPGRFKVTNVEKDKGAFKTPTLRDVADSAPYFHDGSVATLEEAVKIMVDGGIDNPHLDRTNLQKAELTVTELADLIEFLKALDEPTELAVPELPK